MREKRGFGPGGWLLPVSYTHLGQCFRAFVQSYFTSIDTRYADAQEPSAG